MRSVAAAARGSPLKIADTSGQDVALERRPRVRGPVIGGAALLVLLVAAWVAIPAVNRWANASVSVPADRLRIAGVTRGDLVRDVSVQGRVVAAVRPTLYAPAGGTITLNVTAGEGVDEGQVLAVIKSPELASELQQARSTLAQQGVELERQRIESRQLALDEQKEADLADVRLVAAKREKRRADQAHELGVIPVLDYEKAQDDLRNAELAHEHALSDAALFDERLAFELRAAELALERQQLLVDELQRQVDGLELRSPVSGVVGDLLVEQRAAVARDTPVMAVVDLSRFEIEAQIPESYADDLVPGMSAEIHAAGQRYPGEVVAVSPQIVANQVASRIRFVGGMPPNIRQNQQLTTRVLLQEYADVLMLPRGQFLDSGGGRVAYVLNGDGLALRREIQVGARSLSAVQIEAGLAAGDNVIISSIDQFRGADTVLITD
ncbi:MAG: efflux RND transporter periplasmic adaptor subunit [Woeseiaceae bacterium]|nr:efflux RND transporter periplasmic adaptor subunit [Woeseiaceae bacterium]